MNKNILKQAHKMTREIKKEYPSINYSFQLGLCLQYIYEELEAGNMIIDTNKKVNTEYTNYLNDITLKVSDRIESINTVGLIQSSLSEYYYNGISRDLKEGNYKKVYTQLSEGLKVGDLLPSSLIEIISFVAFKTLVTGRYNRKKTYNENGEIERLFGQLDLLSIENRNNFDVYSNIRIISIRTFNKYLLKSTDKNQWIERLKFTGNLEKQVVNLAYDFLSKSANSILKDIEGYTSYSNKVYNAKTKNVNLEGELVKEENNNYFLDMNSSKDFEIVELVQMLKQSLKEREYLLLTLLASGMSVNEACKKINMSCTTATKIKKKVYRLLKDNR